MKLKALPVSAAVAVLVGLAQTYFSGTGIPTQKFHFPQVRLFMTWRFS